jgi:hypothetical protein
MAARAGRIVRWMQPETRTAALAMTRSWPIQFLRVLSDVTVTVTVPLGLSKVAANYTLYASHCWDVVSSGVPLALDRAGPGQLRK